MTIKALHKPIVVGIVGGIASGKSEVTRMLGAMDAKIISADEIGHRVLLEQDVIDSLVGIFGTTILHAAQTGRVIDRKELGTMVFGDSDNARSMRKKLEAIVHPRIRQIAKAELAELSRDESIRIIVLDAPLLIEGGWLPYCDRVLFVDSPESMRRRHAIERGWTETQWRDRETAQMSLDEKRKHATDVLLNDGTIDQLKEKVHDFAMRLRILNASA